MPGGQGGGFPFRFARCRARCRGGLHNQEAKPRLRRHGGGGQRRGPGSPPFHLARRRPGKTAFAGSGQGLGDIRKEVFCG